MDKIEDILKNTTEENQHKVDWTAAWSGKYPVLESYQSEVDIPAYSGEIRRLVSIEDYYLQSSIWIVCGTRYIPLWPLVRMNYGH